MVIADKTIQTLLSRRSVKRVANPGPSDNDIENALALVLRAPDHAKLKPWRFVIIRQPDIRAIGEKAFEILQQKGSPLSDDKLHSTRTWLADLPLLVALAYQIHHDHPKVPEIEQTLAMGAGVMNFQNAMHALGFASFWSTGLATFTEEMAEYLGFDTLETQFVGFLGVGTPKAPIVPVESPDPWSIARKWEAP